LDYLPFGAERINQKTTAFDTRFTYTDQEKDAESGLLYYGARYYDPVIGRFTQMDPVIKDPTRKEFQIALVRPQALNGYAYAINNPLKITDPTGEWWKELFTGQQSFNSFAVEVGDAANYMYDNSTGWRLAMDHPIAAGAATGVVGGAVAYVGAAGLTYLSTNYLGGIGTACIAFCGNTNKVVEDVPKGFKVGETFGKLGTFIGEKPDIIAKTFNAHSADEAARRAVPTKAILETVRNPLVVLQQTEDKFLFLNRQAAVVITKAGEIVTTYSSRYFEKPIIDILNRAP